MISKQMPGLNGFGQRRRYHGLPLRVFQSDLFRYVRRMDIQVVAVDIGKLNYTAPFDKIPLELAQRILNA